MWSLCLAAALAQPSPLAQLLTDEVERATSEMEDDAEVPYYIAASIERWQEATLSARDGVVASERRDDSSYLDIDLRIGSPQLDTTHPLRGFSSLEHDGRRPVQVPIEPGYALRHAVWRELDHRTRDARERIVVLRANRSVKIEEESVADDFEPREALTEAVPTAELLWRPDAWREALVAASGRLAADAQVHSDSVTLQADRVVETFVDSDGAQLEHGRRHARLSLMAATTADDGDEVMVYRTVDTHGIERLDPSALEAWAERALDDLHALRDAPRGEPYSGPVLLRGKASGVFFHEVMGHRVEGHRQKREDEGQTFADHVGRQVMPAWIDVVDDPTVARLAGHDLNGHYAFDDEGVAAAPAPLVDDGVFVGFLMGRSPIDGFEHSNGHGRRSVGHPPQARMGNTLVTASQTRSEAELRAALLAEVRAQDLPYGIIVDEIDGGFTMTGRVMPNAFNVRASTTWRVFPDGRPDQLVRGIDLVGTPLVAFGNLLAAGDDPAVFNGTCGAESGWVPVSAVAPSLLFRKLEFQLKEKGQDRPPLLPKPGTGDADGASQAEAP